MSERNTLTRILILRKMVTVCSGTSCLNATRKAHCNPPIPEISRNLLCQPPGCTAEDTRSWGNPRNSIQGDMHQKPLNSAQPYKEIETWHILSTTTPVQDISLHTTAQPDPPPSIQINCRTLKGLYGKDIAMDERGRQECPGEDPTRRGYQR
jgi:hypothetical protein